MKRSHVEKIAREYGLVVVPGGQHLRVETPDGRLVTVARVGKQRDRGPFSPPQFLRRSIEQALRGQR